MKDYLDHVIFSRAMASLSSGLCYDHSGKFTLKVTEPLDYPHKNWLRDHLPEKIELVYTIILYKKLVFILLKNSSHYVVHKDVATLSVGFQQY